MAEHPIEALMTTAMQSIKDMVDVNTIVGDAVQATDGTVIIPISRVSFGFAAGGGEYSPQSESDIRTGEKDSQNKFPFAGGSGAGVTINPVAFMVVGQNQIRLLPVNINSSLDKVIDYMPEFLENLNETVRRKMCNKSEKKDTDNNDKGKNSAAEKD